MALHRGRLGSTVRSMRRAANLDQTELATRVNEITQAGDDDEGRMTQPRVSDLERDRTPIERSILNLVAIDVACGQPRGQSLRIAGLIDPATDPRQAIMADDRLSIETRESFVVIYDDLLAREERLSPAGLSAEAQRSSTPRRG